MLFVFAGLQPMEITGAKRRYARDFPHRNFENFVFRLDFKPSIRPLEVAHKKVSKHFRRQN
jgi:hypothetical protein